MPYKIWLSLLSLLMHWSWEMYSKHSSRLRTKRVSKILGTFFFYKDKTVVRSWYLHNGNLYTSNWNPHGKRTSLYLNLQGGRSPSKHTESCLKRYKKVACLCDGNRYAVKLVLVYRSGGSGGDNGASLSDEDNEPIARIIPGPPFTNMV